MTDRRIGGLPVMDGQALVGIITETDLFKALLQQLGGRRPGVRVTISAPGVKGTLAKITSAIFGAGGDIVGLGLSEITGSGGMQWAITFKVQDVPMEKLVEAIQPTVDKILDVRET
jgi:acetoin utilization protein AcuB